MEIEENSNYLAKKQYHIDTRLRERIRFHARYSLAAEFEKNLFELIGKRDGAYMLDVGCGTGWIWKNFKQQPSLLALVDNSPAMLESSIRNIPSDIRYLHIISDALNLPFLCSSFEVVILNDLLHHFITDQLEILFKEIHRVAKPGSQAIVTTSGISHLLEIYETMSITDDSYVKILKEKRNKIICYLNQNSYFVVRKTRASKASFMPLKQDMLRYVQSMWRYDMLDKNQQKYVIEKINSAELKVSYCKQFYQLTKK